MASVAAAVARPARPDGAGAAVLRWPGAHPDLLLLLLALILAGLLRTAFVLRAPVFIIPDSENYFLPGFQLARGLGFDLEPRRTPLYPALIAAVVGGVGQDLAALAIVQHALGLVTVGLTYALGRVTFGRTAGFLGALLVGLNGSLLISEQTVTTEPLFIGLLTLAGLVAVLALSGGPRLTLAAGLLLGLAALVRPAGLALVLGFPLVLLAMRPGLRRCLALGALYLVGVALVLLPWMVRNYLTIRVFGTEGAFGQSLVGRTVRHDHFVFAGPSIPPDPDPRRQRARELMQRATDRPNPVLTPLRRELMQELALTELQANQLMRDLAVEAILRQPVYFAIGTAGFFVQLAIGWPERLREAWQTRRDPEAREEWESHPEIAALLGPPSSIQERQLARAEQLASLFQPGRVGLPLAVLFVVGLVGALLGPASRRPALLPALWAAALILVGVALVGPVLRYRYPAEPFLAAVAAGGAVVILERGRAALAILAVSRRRR